MSQQTFLSFRTKSRNLLLCRTIRFLRSISTLALSILRKSPNIKRRKRMAEPALQQVCIGSGVDDPHRPHWMTTAVLELMKK
jgi:hypothetical protein